MLDKEKPREYNIRVNGLVAQLGAHHIRIVGVEGSNPFKSTKRNDSIRKEAVVSFVLFSFHSSLFSLLCKLSYQRKEKREEKRYPSGDELKFAFRVLIC